MKAYGNLFLLINGHLALNRMERAICFNDVGYLMPNPVIYSVIGWELKLG